MELKEGKDMSDRQALKRLAWPQGTGYESRADLQNGQNSEVKLETSFEILVLQGYDRYCFVYYL